MQNTKEFLLSNETSKVHLYTNERIKKWAAIMKEFCNYAELPPVERESVDNASLKELVGKMKRIA